MAWSYKNSNLATFVNKAMRLLFYYWGTHDDKYVVDHLGRKIVFIDNSYTYKTKKATTWNYKDKL